MKQLFLLFLGICILLSADVCAQRPTFFAVIGDYGKAGAGEEAVSQLIQTRIPNDFIVTTGDNNYETGSASTIDTNIGFYYYKYINNYKGKYGLSENKGFFPSLGNHDWGSPGAKPYLDYFTLPGNERYYDTIIGNVHLFSLDSDPNEPDGYTSTSTQALWLKNKLAEPSPYWNIVYFHHPPFSSGAKHGSHYSMQWQFREWGAHLVLSGHEHLYERLVVNGLTYIVNGLGGKSLYPFTTPLPVSKFRYNNNFGALGCEARIDTLLLAFYTVDGSIIDRDTILRMGPPDEVPNEVQLSPVYPNPATIAPSIGFYLPEKQSATIEVTDILGRRIFSLRADFDAGKHTVIANAPLYRSGSYTIRLITASRILTQQLIISK